LCLAALEAAQKMPNSHYRLHPSRGFSPPLQAATNLPEDSPLSRPATNAPETPFGEAAHKTGVSENASGNSACVSHMERQRTPPHFNRGSIANLSITQGINVLVKIVFQRMIISKVRQNAPDGQRPDNKTRGT
jgi:hypothetical protein